MFHEFTFLCCGAKTVYAATVLFRTGSRSPVLRAPPVAAMAFDSKHTWYRDDEVTVDRDGIPHYTGADPSLMREYRRRVIFAYNSLDGEGKDATEEARDLARKQGRFARRLIDGLHGEAWKAVQDLTLDLAKLKEKEGYKHVLAALQSIEKIGIIKKTEAFDAFFLGCHRKRGQSIDSFLRQMKEGWNYLTELSEETTMSEDLRAYFLLKNLGLSREDKRQILLANQSNYNMQGIEQALRVSYFDLHERERNANWVQKRPDRPRGQKKYYAHAAHEGEPEVEEDREELPEPEEPPDVVDENQSYHEPEVAMESEFSDQGASGDDEIFDAYATYQESRKKLKDLQKKRGFFKGSFQGELSQERQSAIEAEKQRSRCGACHRIGHWAGDKECPKTQQNGPRRQFQRKKGSGKGGKSGRGKAKAYMVSDAPTFFTLGMNDEEEAFCNMIRHEDESSDPMLDADLDRRRKQASVAPSVAETEWEKVDQTSGAENATTYATQTENQPWSSAAEESTVSVKVEMQVPVENVKMVYVASVADLRPPNLHGLKGYQLANECESWEILTSGPKAAQIDRLERLFRGEPVQKKGCSKQFIQLCEDDPRAASSGAEQMPMIPKTTPKARPSAMTPKSVPFQLQQEGSASGYGYASKPDSIFRGSEEPEFPKIDANAKRLVDPRSGIVLPQGMAVGKEVSAISCPTCRSPMVLRQNSNDGGLFFGCSRFGQGACRGTRKIADVVQGGSSSSSRPDGRSFG